VSVSENWQARKEKENGFTRLQTNDGTLQQLSWMQMDSI
jgi:hypothetical protein